MSLSCGAYDFLNIVSSNGPQWAVLKEWLIHEGDCVVHFSGFCCELTSIPNDNSKRNSWAILHRSIIITLHGILCLPRTYEDSGIFFDYHTPFSNISQVVVIDSEEYGVVAQVFVDVKHAKTEQQAVYPFGNMHFPDQHIHLTLIFNDAGIRKSFLISLSAVKSNLKILQKKKTNTSFIPVDVGHSYPRGNNVESNSIYDPYRSSTSITGRRCEKSSNPTVVNISATKRRDIKDDCMSLNSPAPRKPFITNVPIHQTSMPMCSVPHNLSVSPQLSLSADTSAMFSCGHNCSEISDVHFDDLKSYLRAILDDNQSYQGSYDADIYATRPKEEDPSRQKEREAIQAMLHIRELNIVQNIENRIRNPNKRTTVEACRIECVNPHTEKLTIPHISDNVTDEELLGPAGLLPLWTRWKSSGGLMGLANRWPKAKEVPTWDDEITKKWNISDSVDLKVSLKNAMMGQIAPKSMIRLQQMYGLVDREYTAYSNKVKAKNATLNKNRNYQESPERKVIENKSIASPAASKTK